MRIQTEAGLTSWGRVIRRDHAAAHPRFVDEVVDWARGSDARRLGIGLRRSYGDNGLSAESVLIDMSGLDRLISFDAKSLELRAEAGLSLDQLMRLMAPRGYFPATTPGTRYVTLGGAISNDVHGKNHHSAGTFGCAVKAFTLLRSDRGVVRVNAESEPELFAAAIGGMGLTGLVLDATISMVPIASTDLDVETVPFGHVDEFFALAAESEGAYEHTVAWVDCTARGRHLGRGVFQRANWAKDGPLEAHKPPGLARMPIDAPGFALNPVSLKLFNAVYYAAQAAQRGARRAHYSAVFHPLDAIQDWNRLYGARGFYQYQCVVPPSARASVADMLSLIANSGEGSFLAVLKSFGARQSPGLMSFPMQGFTLALDFRNRGEATKKLMCDLDAIVRAAGGRLYAAKDGRLSADMMRRGYPELGRFAQSVDPLCRSDFWDRASEGLQHG